MLSQPAKSSIVVPPPPQPWGTRFLDIMRLASPISWYGIAKNAGKSPFVTIDWGLLPPGLIGLLLPPIVLLVTKQLLLENVNLASRSILPCYLVSPWACHCLVASIGKPFLQLGQAGLQQKQFRSPALPDAVGTLHNLVAESSAIRQRRYDMYFPPPIVGSSNNKSHQKEKKASKEQSVSQKRKAILFLPGAGINHVSYAPIAARLAKGGYVVVVVSLEPFRLAQDYLGAEWSSIQRIMTKAEQKLDTKCHWILAGHSFGSFAAMALAHQAHTQQDDHDRNDNLDISTKVVMWASMYLANYATCLKETPIQLLLIQGDKDVLCEMTKASKDAFLGEYLPKECRQVMIKGGTHGGFASYNSTLVEPGGIPPERQQLLACRETLRFLQ